MSLSVPFSPQDLVFGLSFGLIIVAIASALTRNSAEHTLIVAALIFKLLMGLAYEIYVLYIYQGGDTLLYHSLGIQAASELRSDIAHGTLNFFSDYPFLLPSGSSTDHTIGLSGLVHFLVFDSFTAASFVFGLLAFVGQVLLYRAFVDRYPDPRIRVWWRLGILFFPTLTFWSAGLLKESIGIFGLGCSFWALQSFLKKPNPKYLAFLAVGFYTLLLFRIQILLVLLVAAIPFVLFEKPEVSHLSIGRRQSGALTGLLVRMGCLVVALFFAQIALKNQPQFSLAALPETVARQNSNYYDFTFPLIQNVSWTDLLRTWPLDMLTILYRPFLWEAQNTVMVAASIENIIIMALSVRLIVFSLINPTPLVRTFRSPLFLTCVLFVFIFTLGVGASVPNVGSISRYRIAMIPFLIGVFSIFEYNTLPFRAKIDDVLRRKPMKMTDMLTR
jgi:hypothetical protein